MSVRIMKIKSYDDFMPMVYHCRMWNLVSTQWHYAADSVEWYHEITNLIVLPRFIPLGKDLSTDPGLPPLGPNKDQLMQDLNVTFFFDYSLGKLTFIKFILSN